MKRLYRATATYDDCLLDTVRHFQTKRAAESWATQRREGYPATGGGPGLGFLEPERPAIPPAKEVTIDVSAPITFPADQS